uniref:SB domain-containing protein n=1 Tax=Caenorhabditis tropicalis TaxID=1561998 RepID=A0A1I7UZW7_9PELO
MIERLIRLAQEIQKIDGDVKELMEAEKSIERAEKMGLTVSKIQGFHEKLRIKMDGAVQRKMGELDEKADELDAIVRSLLCQSTEAPTAQNFEEDTRLVADYCAELKTFLASTRTSTCPTIPFSVEKAIRRILNNP